MATTQISIAFACTVAFAYGNYRCDLSAVEIDNVHSLRVFIASADKLLEEQIKTDFFLLSQEEIELMKEWAENHLLMT